MQKNILLQDIDVSPTIYKPITSYSAMEKTIVGMIHLQKLLLTVYTTAVV